MGSNKISVSCRPLTDDSQLYHLQIYFDNPCELYEMQLTAEKEMLEFCATISGLSDRDKIVHINDWIAANAVYDKTLTRNSCYSNIVEGTSACNGFARAFHALCSYSGVKCENIRGYVNDILHVWNRVEVDNCWYYVDVTWNSMSHSQKWLLISEEAMLTDHTAAS